MSNTSTAEQYGDTNLHNLAPPATLKIPVDAIIPNRCQPRRTFTDDTLAALTESVREYGVLQPILVRQVTGGKYELIAGERRLRAAKAAGLAAIPAVVREYNDAAMGEVALIENIQREDLNIIEEALAYERLSKEFGLTQEQLAQKIGRSRSHIANIMRLLNLAAPVRELLTNGKLTMGQAKPLLALPLQLQKDAAAIIVAKELSARQAEALVKRLLKNPPPKKKSAARDVFMRDAQMRLERFLGAKVKIVSGKNKNSLHIDFYSPEELTGLIEILTESFDTHDATTIGMRDFVV